MVLVYLGIFLLVLLTVLLIGYAARPSAQTQKTQAALQRLDSYDVRAFRKAELSAPARQRLLGPLIARLGAVSKLITPTGRLSRLGDKVETAGRPWNLDLNGLLALKLVLLILGLIALIILASLEVLPLFWFVLLAVVVVIVTYYLPDMLLYFWIDERRRRIDRALPDFLDLLTVTVEAGLGLDSAMAKIAQKLRDPLREEVLITLHHMRIGQSREEGLREMARRCGSADLESFVSAVVQSSRLGVPLGRILRLQSENMRTVRRQRVEERAQKAPVKMLFPLMLCIFPSLFIVILGPAAIRIYDAFIR